MTSPTAILTGALLSLVAICATAQQTAAPQSNFKVVNNPGGGQYIYGAIPGKGSMPEAIVYTLRNIHAYFGNRPEPGKFFQSRDGSEVAAFFAVNAKNLNDKPMTGLMIVAHADDGSASTAILFDDRSRFGTSEPVMMKALAAAWQPSGAASDHASSPSSGVVSGHRGAAAPLTQTSGGDHSAAIGLPSGWKLTFVGAGAVTAEGPNGEKVFLGVLYQGYAMGPDLFTNFANINNQLRRKQGLAPANYTAVSKTNMPGPSVQVKYTVDLNDGFGPRTGGVRLVSWGANAMQIYGSNLPDRVGAEEGATMQAVLDSYHRNDAVVAREEQGALDRVHADVARAQAQSAAIDARREASTAAYNQQMRNTDAQFASYDAHMDNIDRSSKMQQDYTLDRSVVTDNENGERGTVSNNYADSLVRGNPNRYQIVANQDLIKGKDY